MCPSYIYLGHRFRSGLNAGKHPKTWSKGVPVALLGPMQMQYLKTPKFGNPS